MRFVSCLFVAFLIGSAAKSESPVVIGEPAVQPSGAVRFLVRDDFYPSVKSARENTLRAAQERLRDWLSRQGSPIRSVPTVETISRDMILREFPPEEEPILDRKVPMYRITMEIELQPKRVRELRERDRLVSAVVALGGLLALLGVVVAFFRLDEWTKGYLTRWLIAGGLALSAALVVVWWFIK